MKLSHRLYFLFMALTLRQRVRDLRREKGVWTPLMVSILKLARPLMRMWRRLMLEAIGGEGADQP